MTLKFQIKLLILINQKILIQINIEILIKYKVIMILIKNLGAAKDFIIKIIMKKTIILKNLIVIMNHHKMIN
jgi:hypothetical protein